MKQISFYCKELNITDDPDFGCTIEFSDTVDKGDDENINFDIIINSDEKYFLLQRSYPEEFNENDYYHIETSETNTELSNQDLIIIKMNKKKISFQWGGDQIIIGLNLDEDEYIYLKKAITKRFKKTIHLTEMDF
ncbi:hypothetical protein ACFLSA_01115 [Bacteroidota bacterium]